MPVITLRSVRSDLAWKLDQLEVRAAVLERDVRNLAPADLPPRAPPLASRALWAARAVGQPVDRVIRGLLTAVVRTVRSPRLAFALRLARGYLSDTAICLFLACAGLLISTLALLLVAPPD